MTIESAVQTRTEELLILLVRAGEMFHRSLDIGETLNNVARLSVESFADLCLFDLIDERSDRLYVTAGAHRDPRMEPTIKRVATLFYDSEFRMHPVLRVVQTGEPFWLPKIDDQTILEHAASRQHARYMRELGYRSKIVVPVAAHGQIFGALTFVRTQEGLPFDTIDVETAAELGRRAGLAVANAKQYYRELHVAETLQQAFLTREFPQRRTINFFARYQPGLSESELGGDWYDAFETPSRKLLVTIGDVAGKGVEAARIMVQIRQAIRVASIQTEDPGLMLSLVNRALLLEPGEHLATAFIGIIDPAAGHLVYASAGHAPPLLRSADGSITSLESSSPLLGISTDITFQTSRTGATYNSLLVLYTDGLTEIERDILSGEANLHEVVRSESILRAANPARFLERAIGSSAPRDDIAIMVVQFGEPGIVWRFDAGDPRAGYAVKAEFASIIKRLTNCEPTELYACELIFAELIGNCVRHAPGPLSIALDTTNGLTLHFIDEGPRFDFAPHLPCDLWSETGRGLYLIQSLARSVSVSQPPGCGSHISVVLPVDPR